MVVAMVVTVEFSVYVTVYVHYVCADATTNYERQRELFLFASALPLALD
jgi:hypothetical protein